MRGQQEHIDLYELAGKKFAGTITAEELAVLDRLLADRDNLLSFQALETIWRADPLPAPAVDTEAALTNVHTRITDQEESIKIPRKNFNVFAWVAAASIILFAGIFVLSDAWNSEQIMLAETGFEQKTIRLSDSSTVTLNSESQLSYPESFGEDRRELYLKGEAYFSVTRDTSRPFIVHAGELDITVLGTTFIIRSFHQDSIAEVTVESGRVRVSEKSGDSSLVIVADEAVVLDKKSGKIIKQQAKADKSFWKSRMLKFKRERLQKVVETVNKWYDPNISIAPELSDCMITARFEDKTLEEIVATISGTLNISATQSADSIYLYGDACD